MRSVKGLGPGIFIIGHQMIKYFDKGLLEGFPDMKIWAWLVLPYLLFMPGCSSKGTCLSGDCLNGEGNFRYESGEIYNGVFVNGKPEGLGELSYPDGRKYRGEFVGEIPNGSGELIQLDGSKYVGIFVDGMFSGDGKLVLPDGQELPCQTINGIFVGKSIVGAVKVEETVKVEEMEVKGSPEEADNPVLVGGSCVLGDCLHGQGGFLYEDESFYSGFFVNGMPEGQGDMSKSNGEVYIGEFKNGLYDGEGRIEYPDGTTYEGLFVKGVPDYPEE